MHNIWVPPAISIKQNSCSNSSQILSTAYNEVSKSMRESIDYGYRGEITSVESLAATHVHVVLLLRYYDVESCLCPDDVLAYDTLDNLLFFKKLFTIYYFNAYAAGFSQIFNSPT